MAKKLLSFFLFFNLFLVSSFTVHPADQHIINISDELSENILGVTASFVAVVCAWVAVNYIDKWVKNYYENKVIDKTVNAIVLVLTPHSVINQWPDKQKEGALREKARFINMRKRVLDAIKIKVEQIRSDLSTAHQKKLDKNIYRARMLFAVIDKLRSDNPYEEEYSVPSIVDNVIENKIVEAIISGTKPKSECSREELVQREKSKQKKSKFIEKLKTKINNTVVDQLMKSSLFFHMIWV